MVIFAVRRVLDRAVEAAGHVDFTADDGLDRTGQIRRILLLFLGSIFRKFDSFENSLIPYM